MAKKKIPAKKPIVQVSKQPQSNAQIENEIDRLRDVLKIKKEQTTDLPIEEIKPIEQTEPVAEVQTPSEPITPETVNDAPNVEQTLPVTETEMSNISIADDLGEKTQEDIDKKTIAETVNDFTSSDNTTQRLEDLTGDDFQTNEGATEEEDTPEYRREMSKIKASAIVEFFDVVFMIICLVISKDFSDKNQERFTLVKARKNAIKSNVFQIMAFSKKKHNPMGTVIFLIIFSYVPLIVIAIMERIKIKRDEQAKRQEQLKEEAMMRYNAQFATPQPQPFVNPPQHNFEPVQTKKKARAKIIHVEKNSGHEVKKMKDGSFKNLTTGQVYGGGRGRMPLWVKQYIGKIG